LAVHINLHKDGRITPEMLLETVRRGGGTDNEICLELSFREREPVDHQVVAMIRESVDYWAPSSTPAGPVFCQGPNEKRTGAMRLLPLNSSDVKSPELSRISDRDYRT